MKKWDWSCLWAYLVNRSENDTFASVLFLFFYLHLSILIFQYIIRHYEERKVTYTHFIYLFSLGMDRKRGGPLLCMVGCSLSPKKKRFISVFQLVFIYFFFTKTRYVINNNLLKTLNLAYTTNKKKILIGRIPSV